MAPPPPPPPPPRGSYRILSLRGETPKFGIDGHALAQPPLGGLGACPPQKILEKKTVEALRLILRHSGGTYSHSKVSSICTEHTGVMLKFGCENSWGGGGGLPPSCMNPCPLAQNKRVRWSKSPVHNMTAINTLHSLTAVNTPHSLARLL